MMYHLITDCQSLFSDNLKFIRLRYYRNPSPGAVQLPEKIDVLHNT